MYTSYKHGLPLVLFQQSIASRMHFYERNWNALRILSISCQKFVEQGIVHVCLRYQMQKLSLVHNTLLDCPGNDICLLIYSVHN